MVQRAIVLMLTLGLGAGHIVYRDTSSSNFSDAELQCFMQDKLLHPDGNCYTIRLQGPCEKNQWLVHDKDEIFVPTGQNRRRLVCKPKPCSRPLRVYWPQDGQCHKQTDKAELCPFAGNELKSDTFGEGECVCEKTYVRFKPEVMKRGAIVWDGACYPVYQRGPCPARKILEAEYLEGFGQVGQCVDDPCHRENSRTPGTWFARSVSDGRCYKLGERSPCAAEENFLVDHLTNRPKCMGSAVTEQNLFNGTERCNGNINTLNDTCREEVIVKAEFIVRQIGAPPRRPRSRP